MSIHAPLIDLSKAEIIAWAASWRRLRPDGFLLSGDELGRACGVCDSCRLRAEGFAAAGISDPTLYCV